MNTHRQIAELAFRVLHKKASISTVPLWIKRVMLALMRMCSSVKTYGPIEFLMTVLAMDMIAPTYGKYHLKDFFLENLESYPLDVKRAWKE